MLPVKTYEPQRSQESNTFSQYLTHFSSCSFSLNRITEDELRLMADVDHLLQTGFTDEDIQEDLIAVDTEYERESETHY